MFENVSLTVFFYETLAIYDNDFIRPILIVVLFYCTRRFRD